MSVPTVIREVLEAACHQLLPVQASARADAEILLAFVRGRPRHEPYGFPERKITERELRRFNELIARRIAGEPVAYLVGEKEFWSLTLRVTSDTLVPRPETEQLVAICLEEIGDNSQVADLGTGSGAIALAIAVERPTARVVATELSKAALAIAKKNADHLSVKNVEFRIGDWCEPLGCERFDVVVSNPPYVAAADPHLDLGDLRFEPRLALAGGDDGLHALTEIARHCHKHLVPGGRLLMEHGMDQFEAIAALLGELGYVQICDFEDLAGLPRVCSARRATGNG